MAITYTEEQRELVQLVRDVARNEVMPHVAAADKAGECPRELYQWGFDLGLHMVEIPEQFGGMGLSYETCAMMFEELAWVDAAYADTFVTNFVAFRNILLNGTEEQARHFVEKTENNGSPPSASPRPTPGRTWRPCAPRRCSTATSTF